jgi:hypothetical protein
MDRNQTGHGSLMALSCLSYADSFQARLTSRATFLLHATARYVPVRPQSTYPKGLATPLATSICEHPLPFLCACIETSFRVNDTLTAPFAVASPYKSHNMSSAEPFTLLSIGLITIIVRIYFRWRSVGPANWQIDDYLITSYTHWSSGRSRMLTHLIAAVHRRGRGRVPSWRQIRWSHKQLHDTPGACRPRRRLR